MMTEIEKLANRFDLVTVLGATAGGKTAFAAYLANLLNREIISADSRQVYRRMNIGTGKDYDDYLVNGKRVPVHLIDIAEPGEKYNVYLYQQDFIRIFKEMQSRNKKAVMCGGSGMYIEAIIKDYELISVPYNPELREKIGQLHLEQLVPILESYKKLHNVSDISDKQRLLRAVEIADFYTKNPDVKSGTNSLSHLVLGIKFDRESRRRRISARLMERMSSGMIDEVKNLMDSGIGKETLIYYGLEYKYIALYLSGELNYEEMSSQLETAIHQFSKRQMTWFRKMERGGIKIHWFDGYMSMDQKIERFEKILMGVNA